MAWMIGIDEAGYGPNLGPLVVAATVWRIEDAGRRAEGRADGVTLAASPDARVDLYKRLAALVSTSPKPNSLAIADSKALYKPRGGLQHLERGVLTALTVADDRVPGKWNELVTSFGTLPWYVDFNCKLPLDVEPDEIAELAEEFDTICRENEVRLEGVHRRLVFPREFNELIEQHGTKGAALSHITIALLRKAIDVIPSDLSAPIAVSCDKHGGRNRYAGLLQHHVPKYWIETYEESRGVSCSGWGPPEGHVSVTFRVLGEAELPTALASMTAKYHRELAMKAFNEFWCRKVEGLTPTAGYPQDAKRFKREIAEQQNLLGIDDVDLWRNR